MKKRYVELQVSSDDPHRVYTNNTQEDPYHWASILVDDGGIAVWNGEFYSGQHSLTDAQIARIETGFRHLFLDGREKDIDE